MIRKFFILLGLVAFMAMGLKAQVGINTTNPNDNSILELNSDSKGLLIPRLTKIQMSALTLDPTDEGMLVYCTDLDLFCYFNGADWISMPAWGQKIDLSDPTTEQNISPLNMNSNSGVGVGTTDPQSKLTVLGNLAVGKDSIAPANGAYIFGKVRMGVNAGIENQLEVGGNVNIRGKLKEYGNDLLPTGTIVMWNGTTAPNGWGLCDGTTYQKSDQSGSIVSPNLSGRFIMAAGSRANLTKNSDGTTTTAPTAVNYTPNTINGYDDVALSESQMPRHSHLANASQVTDNYTTLENASLCTDGCSTDDGDHKTYSTSTNRNVTVTVNETGGVDAHENRPPYYVLAYIIKL